MVAPQKHSETEYIYVPVPKPDQDDEIDLIELWNAIWQRKWFVFGITFFCTIVAVIMALFVLKATYKSDIVLQPIETDSSKLSGISSLIGNLQLPLSMLPESENKSANIMSFLKSRTLKTRLITGFNLLPKIYPEKWDKANQKWAIDDPTDEPTVIMTLQKEELEDIFIVTQDTATSLITISWVDEDPEFAATMLDNVVEKLNYYLENEYESDAKRERTFVEEQLSKTEKELDYWERQVPSDKLTLSKIQRERLVAQAVYTDMRKQLELAKISEVKEIIQFKILDAPFVPEKKFKPNSLIICTLTFIVSGLFSLFLILFMHFTYRIRNSKQTSSLNTKMD